MKTGYTRKSGRSLVSAVERDGMTLVAVTINAPDDWRDHTSLLNYGFERLHPITLIGCEEFTREIPVIDGTKQSLTVKNSEEIKLIFDGTVPEIEREISLKPFAVAPIQKGDVLGNIAFKSNGNEIARVTLVATENIEKTRKSKLFNFDKTEE